MVVKVFNPSTQEAVRTGLCAFEASMVYAVSSRLVQLHSEILSQKVPTKEKIKWLTAHCGHRLYPQRLLPTPAPLFLTESVALPNLELTM